jgi:hypothetical protein
MKSYNDKMECIINNSKDILERLVIIHNEKVKIHSKWYCILFS